MELIQVSKTEIKKKNKNGKQVVVTGKGFTSMEAEQYNPAGIETNPPKKYIACLFPVVDGSSHVFMCGANYNIEPEIEQGGIRLYSTDEEGKKIMSFVRLNPDGSLSVSSGDENKAVIEIDKNGNVKIEAVAKIDIKNQSASLYTVLNGLIDHIKGLKTTNAQQGAPCTLSTETIAQLSQDAEALKGLLEE